MYFYEKEKRLQMYSWRVSLPSGMECSSWETKKPQITNTQECQRQVGIAASTYMLHLRGTVHGSFFFFFFLMVGEDENAFKLL